MDKCIKEQAQINETIGIDVGDKYSSICVLRADGSNARHRVRTTQQAMSKFLNRQRVHIVLEVGPHSRWLSELCTEHGHQLTVANPRAVKLISGGQRKSDKRDAELLARLGRADTSLLSPVHHRSGEAQNKLAVLKARDTLVRARTSLKLHIIGVLKSHGVRIPKSSGGSFLRHVQERMPQELAPALRPLCSAMEQMNESIKGYDKQLKDMAEQHPGVWLMRQIHGVGVLTALGGYSGVTDHWFRAMPISRSKATVVCGYLGLLEVSLVV